MLAGDISHFSAGINGLSSVLIGLGDGELMENEVLDAANTGFGVCSDFSGAADALKGVIVETDGVCCWFDVQEEIIMLQMIKIASKYCFMDSIQISFIHY